MSFSWWCRVENLSYSSLTNKRFSHSSAREVTAIQLLFKRLSLSSTKVSFLPKTVFKASPSSVMLFRWTFCFSVSFWIACRKNNIWASRKYIVVLRFNAFEMTTHLVTMVRFFKGLNFQPYLWEWWKSYPIYCSSLLGIYGYAFIHKHDWCHIYDYFHLIISIHTINLNIFIFT